MIDGNFKNIGEIIAAFPTEQTCIVHLEQLRWNGFIRSPFDPNSKVYSCTKNRYRCRNSGKYFNAKTNTLFHNSKIELQKWFIAIWLTNVQKRKITTTELGRSLNITQKSAWLMLKNIEDCFGKDLNIQKPLKTKSKKIKAKLTDEIEVVVENDKLQMVEWLNLLKK